MFSRTSFVRLILQMTTTAARARARLPKKEKKRGETERRGDERTANEPTQDGGREFVLTYGAPGAASAVCELS